jgi:uncharacterized membrane protein
MHLAAIRQLEYPAVLMGAATITHPKKITGCVHGYATAGVAERAERSKAQSR